MRHCATASDGVNDAMSASDHLVHGMGTALEAPTWPAISPVQAQKILAGFDEAGPFETLSWHSPRPFSAAALVHTDRGEFVLKRHHHRLRSPAALAPEHAFMAHLRCAGLSVPEVMRTHEGVGAIADNGWTYELHRKAAGLDVYRDRPSWTPFLNHDHALGAGKALALLHLAARGFDAPDRAPDPLIASFTILPAPDPLAAAQTYIARRPALARFLAGKPWRMQLGRLLAMADPSLGERLRCQSPMWTHNDWHPSNLLWSADGTVTTVFDFGVATRTCAAHDLATAIERTAVPWLSLHDGSLSQPIDVTAATHLVAGYRTVLPLTQDDITTVALLLPLVHLEFALSEIDYFAGIVGDYAQAEIAWQRYAVDHADWFGSPAGQQFLEQFSCEVRI